jgi:hypothetical protein
MRKSKQIRLTWNVFALSNTAGANTTVPLSSIFKTAVTVIWVNTEEFSRIIPILVSLSSLISNTISPL